MRKSICAEHVNLATEFVPIAQIDISCLCLECILDFDIAIFSLRNEVLAKLKGTVKKMNIVETTGA
jgi:hypothetical protein